MQHIQHKRLAKRLVPRFEPTWLGQQADPTSTPAEPTSTVAVLPPVVATPDPVVTSTPTVPTQVPATSAPAASTSNPVVNTPAASSSTPVVDQSTSSLLTSSTALASSSTPLTVSSSSTPAAVQSTPAQQSSTRAASTPAQIASSGSVTVRGGTTLIVTATASSTGSASPSATAAPSSSNAGTIVGAVAGSLVGIVCLIAFVSWIIRQHNRRKSGNHDDFDRQSYLRNSMMIPDEPGAGRPVIGTQAALALARNNTVHPRPPTMIERKPTYLMHNGQPEPSFNPGQVVSFEPGQIVSAPPTADVAAYPSPMAFAAYTPPAQHHQSELSRRPSGAKLLDRQPTNGGMYDAPYVQAPSPVGYGSDPYAAQTPQSYQHDGYTYPMHPGTPNRTMIQSVTPFQAQQYAEITRALEGPDFGNDSFHPISPVSPAAGASAPSPPSPPQKALPNPFEEPPAAPSQRIDSTPPSLPALESLSRTGTPIDPNPQHAHWSYDGKGQAEGHRLSVAGMPAPIVEAPAMPPAAVTREQRLAPAVNAQNQRPVSVVDTDDAYGGM